jgi:nitrite reductase (cytochrome c-552)
MKTIREISERKPWINWVLFFTTVVVVFLLGLLASSIVERRSEAQLYFQMVNPIPDWEPNNSVWGANFPRQYETYRQTLDTTFRSQYAGYATIDYLAQYPELVVMWAGYPFSRDYNQGRGHMYSVGDVQRTLRTTGPMPATCWTCKSTDVPRMMNQIGVAEFYALSLRDMGHEIQNPIGCQDCHDPQTMSLRITRPALVEAFERRGVNIQDASLQEMRSLVCAQCHVEYYFGANNYLIFPWDKGFSAEEMEAHLDEAKHVDWVHSVSRAPMLKAQHPDYELYMTGIHAQRGVSCADCHLPYHREGGVKFTNHHISSPLNNIAGTCQVCHRQSEETLIADVVSRQDKISELRRITERNLARVHIEAKAAWDLGATEAEMQGVLQLIRQAQWRWDWVAAANGYGIHSPNEALRVLGMAIQKSQEARIELARIFSNYGRPFNVEMPDISTKEKAQAFINLDMERQRELREQFLRDVLPGWQEQQQQR